MIDWNNLEQIGYIRPFSFVMDMVALYKFCIL